MPPGNRFQVLRHRRIEIERAPARWPSHDFFHVAIGRVQQTAWLGCRQNCNRVRRSRGTKVCSLERIDCDIDSRMFPAIQRRSTDALANIEHRSLVPLAFANNNIACYRHRLESTPHCLNSGLVGILPITFAHRAGARNSCFFHDAHKMRRKIAFEIWFS